jgi:hypothetical protein
MTSTMSPSTPDRPVRRRTTCRVCDGTDLHAVLSLGPTPLANAFLRSPDEFAQEPRFPLDLYFCRNCSLLQLLDVVDPSILFDHYIYVSGTSATMAAHNAAYAAGTAQMLGLTAGDLVVDIASNDGSLLQQFRRLGIGTLGVEPARNLAAAARANGVDTINVFFSAAAAREIISDRGPARLVCANNVLAHVDRPDDFLAGCLTLVADDGLVTIEVPYVRELVERLEYDTVYHEHLSYFSVTALLALCARVGLFPVRIDHVPVHGGSLRLYLSPRPAPYPADVRQLIAREKADGLTTLERYLAFADAVKHGRSELVSLLRSLRESGSRVAGYGAPAKGNTLLNYCGIDRELMPFTVDKNALKVGTYTPGAHIPVMSTAALETAAPPDYVLILAWNFADEIIQQQEAHRARGGKFIIPIPTPQVM